MTVFVLGAGATRGCSFVKPAMGGCLPPLDGDFFTQLQRIKSAKHQLLVSSVVKDVVKLFGLNFDVTMETVFTTLDHTIRMVELKGETRGFRLDDLRAMRANLLQAVAAILEESLTEKDAAGNSTLKLRQCDYFKEFVQKVLEPEDTVITFNYDCVIDSHLHDYGENKWNARYGYGLNLGARGKSLEGDKAWSPKINPATKETTVKLFKLHGSLHFDVTGADKQKYKVKLKQRPYTNQGRGLMHFTIIPPEWYKRFDRGFFSDIWNAAADAIYRTDRLVFIGYSLPITDMHATALFRTSINKSGLTSLVVVNPDRATRRRIRSVVQSGISESSRVLSFDTLSEFVSTDSGLWRL